MPFDFDKRSIPNAQHFFNIFRIADLHNIDVCQFDQMGLMALQPEAFTQDNMAGICIGLALLWLNSQKQNMKSSHKRYSIENDDPTERMALLKKANELQSSCVSAKNVPKAAMSVGLVTSSGWKSYSSEKFMCDMYSPKQQQLIFMNLLSEKGGHAVGFTRTDGLCKFFDPNYGIFSAMNPANFQCFIIDYLFKTRQTMENRVVFR